MPSRFLLTIASSDDSMMAARRREAICSDSSGLFSATMRPPLSEVLVRQKFPARGPGHVGVRAEDDHPRIRVGRPDAAEWVGPIELRLDDHKRTAGRRVHLH